MATVVHCLYCFDVLSTNLEKKECLSLARVQDLWAEFNSKDPIRLEGTSLEEQEEKVKIQGDGDEEDEIIVENIGQEEEDEQGSAAKTLPSIPPPIDLRLPIPSISRLRNPSGSNSSSSSSTPSTLSTASSRSALTDSSSSVSSNPPSSVGSTRRPYNFGFNKREAKEEYPLFVTWNTISSRGTKSLRGCIGTFDPSDLSHGLKSYALTAAFDDTRFPPISQPELPTLEAAVTFLTDFTPISDPFNWTIGTHGLRISFTYHTRRYNATYLPNVAEEQGWNREETVVSLMRKAGWTGRSSEWKKVGDLKVVRYEGKKASVGYEEWREWRDWVDGKERGKGKGKGNRVGSGDGKKV